MDTSPLFWVPNDAAATRQSEVLRFIGRRVNMLRYHLVIGTMLPIVYQCVQDPLFMTFPADFTNFTTRLTYGRIMSNRQPQILFRWFQVFGARLDIGAVFDPTRPEFQGDGRDALRLQRAKWQQCFTMKFCVVFALVLGHCLSHLQDPSEPIPGAAGFGPDFFPRLAYDVDAAWSRIDILRESDVPITTWPLLEATVQGAQDAERLLYHSAAHQNP